MTGCGKQIQCPPTTNAQPAWAGRAEDERPQQKGHKGLPASLAFWLSEACSSADAAWSSAFVMFRPVLRPPLTAVLRWAELHLGLIPGSDSLNAATSQDLCVNLGS